MPVQDEGVAYRGAALVEIRTELTEGTPSVPISEIDREDIIRVQVRRAVALNFALYIRALVVLRVLREQFLSILSETH